MYVTWHSWSPPFKPLKKKKVLTVSVSGICRLILFVSIDSLLAWPGGHVHILASACMQANDYRPHISPVRLLTESDTAWYLTPFTQLVLQKCASSYPLSYGLKLIPLVSHGTMGKTLRVCQQRQTSIIGQKQSGTRDHFNILNTMPTFSQVGRVVERRL